MNNTEGFDRLYSYIIKKYHIPAYDTAIKETLWTVFSDRVLSMDIEATEAERERRLNNLNHLTYSNLDLMKVMSGLFIMPLYKLVDERGNDAVWHINMEGELCRVYPVYTSMRLIRNDTDISLMDTVVSGTTLRPRPTTIMDVLNYVEKHRNIKGVFVNHGTADFAMLTDEIEEYFMNFNACFNIIGDCLTDGITEDYLFPMLLDWFKNYDVEILLKDGSFCKGPVAEVIHGHTGGRRGDAVAVRVKNSNRSSKADIIVLINVISRIRAFLS